MLIATRIRDDDTARERYRVELASDVARVGEAVDTVAACCFRAVEASGRTRFRLCTVVAEAVANAMVYGNHGDPARRVTIEIEVLPDRLVIAVTDEGEGFDPRVVPDPTTDDALEGVNGRGLFMIHRLADHVVFNDRGNTIWMTLPRC